MPVCFASSPSKAPRPISTPNTSDHHHFFIEGENKVFDIALGPVQVINLPEPPEGMEIANVDIVVRLRPKRERLILRSPKM